MPAGTLKRDDLASFRLLVAYMPTTDDYAMRLDVKVGELQHGRALAVSVSGPKSGERICADDPLIEPSKGVDRAASVLVDRCELVAALRDLADKLEQMR
jgi:hypothetical protein